MPSADPGTWEVLRNGEYQLLLIVYIKNPFLSSVRAGTASALDIFIFSLPGTVPGK